MRIKIMEADWVIPVSSPPVRHGAVVFDNHGILFIGNSIEAQQRFPQAIRADLSGKVIVPGLVNPHTHLDFSLYKNRLSLQKNDSMFDWIERVIDLQPTMTPDKVREGAIEGIEELKSCRTALIGDITHDPFTVEMLEDEEFQGACFHEVSGFLPDAADHLYAQAKEVVDEYSGMRGRLSHYIAPHSPYAVSEKLLERIAKDGQRCCFHLAESQDEVAFLKQGESRMQKILEKLGKWDSSWKAPGVSPVRYFAALGLLHEKSIAVHMTSVTEKDYKILEHTRPHICLCPRSNEWLNNGLPPAEDYLGLGLNVCLATDGLGSNHDLSMFNEMKFFRQKFPNISPAKVLEMATINGARALGLDERFGTLEEGKAPNVSFIANPDFSDPYSFLDAPLT